MDEKELVCIVHGKVQGVKYRAFIKKQADTLGLYGMVSNEEDGTVEIIVQGEEKVLKEFLAHIKKGSLFSRVDDVEESWHDDLQDSFTEFAIQ